MVRKKKPFAKFGKLITLLRTLDGKLHTNHIWAIQTYFRYLKFGFFEPTCIHLFCLYFFSFLQLSFLSRPLTHQEVSDYVTHSSNMTKAKDMKMIGMSRTLTGTV